MKTLTKQQIFDRVCYHFLTKRRKQSFDPSIGTCVYRSKNGAKCGIGCLFPDTLYTPAMDKSNNPKKNAWHRNKHVRQALISIGVDTKRDSKLLTAIQHAHDHSVNIRENLKDVATKFKLTISSGRK